jgi:radical SAM superfamily enzyme YgiQ (UPF0313 family)
MGLACVMTYFNSKGLKYSLLDVDIDELSDHEVEEYFKNTSADIVLLGCIVTHYKWVKWFVSMVKGCLPKSKIIVGNSVGSSIPETLLYNTSTDIVILGEGEISAYEVTNAIINNEEVNDIKGIAFRDANGAVVINERRSANIIDNFPIVKWDDFDVNKYMEKFKYSFANIQDKSNVRPMPISTARGCAFKCTFCHYVFWNDPYRHRSADLITQEIIKSIDLYGANYFVFWDDLSFASAGQAKHLAKELLKLKHRINWSAAIRVDIFSRNRMDFESSLEIARLMKQSGCDMVTFSLESGDDEILKMMSKEVAVTEFMKTADIFNRVGITCNTSVVFGYPIETEVTIIKTFEQCRKAGIYPSIGYLLPLPQTKMYEYAVSKGYIDDEDAYLTSITERQDICINMTKLTNHEILSIIEREAGKLADSLGLYLGDDKIRTRGYKNKSTIESQESRTRREGNSLDLNYASIEYKSD